MTDSEPPRAEPSADDLSPHDADSSTGATRSGRLLTVIGWSVLGVAALGVAWIVVTGLIARSQLTAARAEIGHVRRDVVSGDIDHAARTVDSIKQQTSRAAWLTSGPAWWVASNIPGVGAPLRTGRTLATQSARLGDTVLPGVLELARTLPQQRGGAGSVDLAAIERSAPRLHDAAETARSVQRTLEDTDGSWLPFAASARASVVHQLTSLTGELDGADRAVGILLPMLGRSAPQRYFIGFLNEAESRGGGGIPGAYAIATVDDGHITFEHFGSDQEFEHIRAKVDLGPELTARYGNNDPTGTIQNSNLSPDFSVAGRIWAGLWQAKTGERVDGSLGIDPTALSYLLKVTGPATLAGGGAVGSDDVVRSTQSTQYARFPGLDRAANTERKQYLQSIARAVSTRLTGRSDPARLVRALSRAASERRFTVWSRVPALETRLRAAAWAGVLGRATPGTYSGFVVNNAAGNKLDYYLDRSMTYRRSDCGAGGTATATMRLTNDAPRTGLPAYVTYRADTPPAGAVPGDNRLLVTYYADRSARITGMTVDGRAVPVVPQPEGDTTALTTTIELPVQSRVTISVTVAEPAASGPVEILRQPLVRPLQVRTSGCAAS